ncbi:hypothetical protein [Pseudarthrobacter sp. N5]|uniref:hypothetical protein n=1 Tax=Pseudarthrobacter sp. N5 TaxID=3418416 RepID=UPI003CE8D4D8
MTPVRDLEPCPEDEPVRKLRRFLAPLETSIILRAVAIVCIVSTHVGLFRWQGTAHVLMAVAGYNFARFQLSGERLPRLRRQLKSAARVAVPSMAFIGAAYLSTDKYSPANIVLLNAIIGPETVTTQWHFWFIEVLVYLLVGMGALLAIPWASRAERRFPLLFPLALTGVGLLTRYELIDPGVPHTAPALWLFALGWAIARTRNVAQRCVVSAVAALTFSGVLRGHEPGMHAPHRDPAAHLATQHSRAQRLPPPDSTAGQRLPLRIPGPLAGLPAAGPDKSTAGRGSITRRRGRVLGPVHARDQRGHPPLEDLRSKISPAKLAFCQELCPVGAQFPGG